MTVYYVSPDTSPGDTIHLGSTSCASTPWRELTMKIVEIDCTAHSDYLGGTHAASNCRVILEDEELTQHVITILGSHGGMSLAYIPTDQENPECGHSVPDALRDTVAGLANYPILDDDDHSHLEMDLESEAWEDWGRKDFAKDLAQVLDVLDPTHEHEIDPDRHGTEGAAGEDNTLYGIWREGCDTYNIEGGAGCVHEFGGSVHFYIQEWCQVAERSVEGDLGLLRQFSPYNVGAHSNMRAKLLRLARATRTEVTAEGAALRRKQVRQARRQRKVRRGW